MEPRLQGSARQRRRAPIASKSAAVEQEKEVISTTETPTLREFAPRFMDGYARANRQKPSGIAAKLTVLKVHVIRQPRQQAAGRDHKRGRPALEEPSSRKGAEDGEQRVDHVEYAAEAGRRMERHRPASVYDSSPAHPQGVGPVSRFRRIRAAGDRRENRPTRGPT